MKSQDRILVTGASGFIGRAVVDALRQLEAEVHGTLSPSSELDADGDRGVTYHRVNLLDRTAVADLAARVQPTHLLHLAWNLAPGELNAAHHVAWTQASLDLLAAFQAQGGRRAVLAGSCFEYDFAYGYCTEDVTPEQPSTIYGRAKNGLYRLATAYAEPKGLSVAWARIFFVYGPGEASHRLVPHVIDALSSRQPAVCTHGRQIRDYLHVADVAAAMVALLRSEVQGAVNVGSGIPVTLRDIIHEIADQLDAHDLVQLGGRTPNPDEPPLLVANPLRLRDKVGWTPSFSLAEGIRDTIRARTHAHLSTA